MWLPGQTVTALLGRGVGRCKHPKWRSRDTARPYLCGERVVCSRAPLRLGLAGGASDVPPYCDRYGGCVVNATVDLYAYTFLEPTSTGTVEFCALDHDESCLCEAKNQLRPVGPLLLHRAVHNQILRLVGHGMPLSVRVSTYSDVPRNSGLGASSALVVSLLRAYSEWLNLTVERHQLAQLACGIERHDLGLPGGRQDQYAAVFGGFNFMEFGSQNRVAVHSLRLKQTIVEELQSSMILYYSGIVRESDTSMREQVCRIDQEHSEAIEATHQLKQAALHMRDALVRCDVHRVGEILGSSWNSKKKLACGVSNDAVELVYERAIEAGAYAGRISGAGGGGFMVFMADPVRRRRVVRVLEECGGRVFPLYFTQGGARSWVA